MVDEESVEASDFSIWDTVPEEIGERLERNEDERSFFVLEYFSRDAVEPKRLVNVKALESSELKSGLDDGYPIHRRLDSGDFGSVVDSYLESVYSEHIEVGEVDVQGSDEQIEAEISLVYDPDYDSNSDVLPGIVTVTATPDEEYLQDGEVLSEYIEEIDDAI